MIWLRPRFIYGRYLKVAAIGIVAVLVGAVAVGVVEVVGTSGLVWLQLLV